MLSFNRSLRQLAGGFAGPDQINGSGGADRQATAGRERVVCCFFSRTRRSLQTGVPVSYLYEHKATTLSSYLTMKK